MSGKPESDRPAGANPSGDGAASVEESPAVELAAEEPAAAEPEAAESAVAESSAAESPTVEPAAAESPTVESAAAEPSATISAAETAKTAPGPHKRSLWQKVVAAPSWAWRRLKPTGSWIKEHYCYADPRTLGLFRLVLGFLLAADCVRHWSVARWFYSNSGVLTNHYHLFRPSGGYNFSIFHAFSTLPEVHVAFALSFICYLCFCIGYRTRLFSILSFFFVTSMDNRLVMVENGGYVVVNLIVCWAMFMPTGRRFSVDAWLRSYRERKERTGADLNARWRPAWLTEPFVSGIVLIALLNLGTIYFFNVINKSGQIWRRGETVHYVLHLDRMVTGVAVLVREHFPLWSLKLLTWAVLAHEALLLTWIMSPYGRRVTRLCALIGIWLLHGGFGVMMRLGPFSWFLMGWGLLLLEAPHWDMLERWYRRRSAPRVVLYDASSPLAFVMVRWLARADSLDQLRFEEAPTGGIGPLLAARDPETEQLYVGGAAVREILQALPGGRYLRGVLVVATLGLIGPIFGAISRRRAGIARFFGLTHAPAGALQPLGADRAPEPALLPIESPLRRKLVITRVWSRELLIGFLGVSAFSQAINENKSIPAFVKHKQPKVMEAVIQYPRIFQGWGMFAPNPISDDGSLSIDARTIDGRSIDPFTGKEPDLVLTDARGLGLGQIWQDYFNRIRFDRNKAFLHGLKEYLLKYHHETGRPEDELVAFDVYWVRDQCPKPGQTEPYKNETIAILTYRKPSYKPPPGKPPLPPEPKTASAGN